MLIQSRPKKTSLFNIQSWPNITQHFHFYHFVIELKPYIKRRFIDGAQWPTRCHNSAIRSCRFVIRLCLFLWGGQTQLKQHWTSNFERTITDKWNTTLLPCSYVLSDHNISIHMTFIGDAGAPLWSKGHCHVIPQRWGWWEWGNNLWTVGAYSWPGDDWSTILCGEKAF